MVGAVKSLLQAMHQIAAASILLLSIGYGAGQELPAPEGSLRQLRFSPDGRYVFAQDDSEITLLTVEPFTILFRIPTRDAIEAQFTPDSRSVVFVSSSVRVDAEKIALAKSAAQVERWSLTEHTRAAATTLPSLVCGTEKLSPDGGVLACVDLKGALHFIDIASGRTLFAKKGLGSPTIEFSPDGHFIIVKPQNPWEPDLVWNVRGRSLMKLSGPLKQLKGQGSVFIAPDKIFISEGEDVLSPRVGNARVIAFPSGQLLSQPQVLFGAFARATDRGFVIVHYFGSSLSGQNFLNRAAAVELSTGKVFVSETPALDVFSPFVVAERKKGEVGLYEIGKAVKAAVVLHTVRR